MIKKDGGPAFPCDNIVQRDDQGYLFGVEVSASGISIRDYFAAKAMVLQFGPSGSTSSLSDIALFSYQMADAMIEARNK